MAEALYNKYRPQVFEDVVGQEHIENTLKNAIAADKISHAYMFSGPRGTGKTTTARLLSKALLCTEGPTPDPDGTCEDCRLIAAGEHPDVYELDAASRTGVENVREEIIGKVGYAPTRGRFKVYIIDEVHMLSTAAFNALLKTLEEPPDHVVFILCTTDPQKVPETILSRCQRFDFHRISLEEMVARLGAICEMEGVSFEGDALDLIAHRAQGGMRDALTSLDQLIAFGQGEVTTEVAERLLGSLDSSDLADIVKAIGLRDAAACFNWTAEYMETGADLVQFVEDLTVHMRDMYVMSLVGADVALEITEAGRRELEVELSWYGPERLSRMLEVLGDLSRELKTSTNQRLSFEIALTRMVRPESDLTLSSLSERIESLEKALALGAVAAPSSAASLGAVQTAPAGDGLAKEPAKASDADVKASESGPIADSGAGAGMEHGHETGSSPYDAGEVSEPATSAPRMQGNAAQLWSSVLAHLKKLGPAYGIVFMDTNASYEGDVLAIEFPQGNDFAFKTAQKQDARDALEKAFERAGASGMKYRVFQGQRSAPQGSVPPWEDEPAVEPSEVQPESASASYSDLVQKQEDASRDVSKDAMQDSSKEVSKDAMQDSYQTEDASKSDPDAQAPSEDPDFQDFLTSAFGEGLVIEEIE